MTTGVVVLGEISGVFGVKGWLKIRSYTRPEDQILAYREILVGNVNEWLSFKVSEVSGSNKALRISLASILSRDGAEQLVGKKFAVERKSLKNVQKGEDYWLDKSVDLTNQKMIVDWDEEDI